MNTLLIGILLLLSTLRSVVSPTEPQTVVVVAHRGLPTVAPENTITSFRKAIDLGVDMLEVDVQQTKDGHLVVLHDKTIDRTTDGRGELRQLTLEEIKSYDAGSWFGEGFRGETIPTLAELVAILDDRTELLLEIKHGSPYHQGIEERLVAFIREYGLESRVLVKSFDAGVVKRVRELAPDLRLGISVILRIPFLSIIVHRGVRIGNLMDEDVDFLHVHRIGVTRSLIENAHQRGLQVIVWDVHDEKTMRQFIDMGVDAIETDESALLLRIRPSGRPIQFTKK